MQKIFILTGTGETWVGVFNVIPPNLAPPSHDVPMHICQQDCAQNTFGYFVDLSDVVSSNPTNWRAFFSSFCLYWRERERETERERSRFLDDCGFASFAATRTDGRTVANSISSIRVSTVFDINPHRHHRNESRNTMAESHLSASGKENGIQRAKNSINTDISQRL